MTKRRPTATAVATIITAALLLGKGALAAEDGGAAQIVDDCRIEGQTAGLEDSALDEFVRDCIADLGTVEFSNMVESDR